MHLLCTIVCKSLFQYLHSDDFLVDFQSLLGRMVDFRLFCVIFDSLFQRFWKRILLLFSLSSSPSLSLHKPQPPFFSTQGEIIQCRNFLIGWQTPPPPAQNHRSLSFSLLSPLSSLFSPPSSLLSPLSSLLSCPVLACLGLSWPVSACLCSRFQAQLGFKNPLKSCLVLSCLVLVCLGLSWPVLASLFHTNFDPRKPTKR